MAASRLTTFLMGDPPRRFLKRSMRLNCAPGARCDYLACYDMDHTTLAAAHPFPRSGRTEIFDLVIAKPSVQPAAETCSMKSRMCRSISSPGRP